MFGAPGGGEREWRARGCGAALAEGGGKARVRDGGMGDGGFANAEFPGLARCFAIDVAGAEGDFEPASCGGCPGYGAGVAVDSQAGDVGFAIPDEAIGIGVEGAGVIGVGFADPRLQGRGGGDEERIWRRGFHGWGGRGGGFLFDGCGVLAGVAAGFGAGLAAVGHHFPKGIRATEGAGPTHAAHDRGWGIK